MTEIAQMKDKEGAKEWKEGRKLTRSFLSLVFICVICVIGGYSSSPAADEAPGPAATLVKILSSGKVPPERQGNVVALICQRGNASELAFVFGQCVKPSGFTPAVRRQALDALAEATRTRKLQPSGDLSGLRSLMEESDKSDPGTRLAALRLSGLWKVAALRPELEAVALSPKSSDALREAALEGLLALGGKENHATFEKLSAADRPLGSRVMGITALARQDPATAAGPAADVLSKATDAEQVAPLIGAFLEAKGGPDRLATALGKTKLSADAAKLALRQVYAAGHSDANLVKVLSDAAGVESSDRVWSKKEIDDFLTAVKDKGDAARGERVFRRVDLNCMKCHSLAGAGGNVGPDLGTVGSTSPPDYLLRSVLYPDESIKEEFLTVLVTTTAGKIYQGIVVEDGADRLVLKDATGTLKVIPKADVEDRQKGGSLMPKGLANLMTRAELVDLVRFLSELGKTASYPVQTAPVLRRWRLLDSPDPAIVRDVPDEDNFRKFVAGVEPSRWKPVYSLHNGSVPLDDLSAPKGVNIVYLQAEIEVKTAGQVGLKLDSEVGLDAWVDERIAPVNKVMQVELEAGRRRITFRIDRSKRKDNFLRVELAKVEGSEAEAAPIGGP
jgi:putative heme-binding domain-containing protein